MLMRACHRRADTFDGYYRFTTCRDIRKIDDMRGYFIYFPQSFRSALLRSCRHDALFHHRLMLLISRRPLVEACARYAPSRSAEVRALAAACAAECAARACCAMRRCAAMMKECKSAKERQKMMAGAISRAASRCHNTNTFYRLEKEAPLRAARDARYARCRRARALLMARRAQQRHCISLRAARSRARATWCLFHVAAHFLRKMMYLFFFFFAFFDIFAIFCC